MESRFIALGTKIDWATKTVRLGYAWPRLLHLSRKHKTLAIVSCAWILRVSVSGSGLLFWSVCSFMFGATNSRRPLLLLLHGQKWVDWPCNVQTIFQEFSSEAVYQLNSNHLSPSRMVPLKYCKILFTVHISIWSSTNTAFHRVQWQPALEVWGWVCGGDYQRQ